MSKRTKVNSRRGWIDESRPWDVISMETDVWSAGTVHRLRLASTALNVTRTRTGLRAHILDDGRKQIIKWWSSPALNVTGTDEHWANKYSSAHLSHFLQWKWGSAFHFQSTLRNTTPSVSSGLQSIITETKKKEVLRVNSNGKFKSLRWRVNEWLNEPASGPKRGDLGLHLSLALSPDPRSHPLHASKCNRCQAHHHCFTRPFTHGLSIKTCNKLITPHLPPDNCSSVMESRAVDALLLLLLHVVCASCNYQTQKGWTLSSDERLKNSFYLFRAFLLIRADGQTSLFRQSMQCGFIGEQTVCPKPTRRWFISLQSSRGTHDSSSRSVSMGFFVSSETHLSRFDIRWTCVSTAIPVHCFQAICMTKWAIFGPTPGKLHRSYGEER